MSSGSAHITSTPTKAVVVLQNTGVAQKASPSHSPSRFREGHTFTYHFGYRKQGDTLIDFRRDHETYSSPQDVKLLVKCHAEPGHTITNALIEVKQSSEIRDGHIIDGGIGQNHITIQIEAGKTHWFNYEVRIYGIKTTTETHLEMMDQ